MTDTQNTRLDTNWLETFGDVITTCEEAISHIRPGQRVFIGTGCAQPQELVRALVDRSSKLTDVEVTHLLTVGEAPKGSAETKSA